uniref:Uncharacterized protein n=1 Tax=Trichobilharzia regenti TaxID=157069 RepID=A0AA85IY38_TRIRE|nr:unnamed protein product [Trichobilharzia regenti]
MISKIWLTLLASTVLYVMFLPPTESGFLMWLVCCFAPNHIICKLYYKPDEAKQELLEQYGHLTSSNGQTPHLLPTVFDSPVWFKLRKCHCHFRGHREREVKSEKERIFSRFNHNGRIEVTITDISPYKIHL